MTGSKDDLITYRLSRSKDTYEEDCIFIEPSNLKMKIPNDFFRENHFSYGLRLTGQFYLDLGVPKHYDRKTPEKLEKAKVFRYDKFEFVKVTRTK